VDSVANVEAVVADLKRIAEADVVTAPEAVSTARTTLGTLAATSAYAAAQLFAIGAVLVVSVMVLAKRERVREIGTLKAIGASDREVALQFVAEAVALSGLGAGGALLLAGVAAAPLGRWRGAPIEFDGRVALVIGVGAAAFAMLGNLYPVARGVRLSPLAAMREMR
jgi:ABC-type antimicrobial peptide transport system permease subunit